MSAPPIPKGHAECPVCYPIPYPKCAGCKGKGYVRSEDYYLIKRTVR